MPANTTIPRPTLTDDARAIDGMAPPHPRWMHEAACMDGDTDVFFVSKGARIDAAVRQCMPCDVRATCLFSAVIRNEKSGVWGGRSNSEREQIMQIVEQRGRHRAAAQLAAAVA